MSRKTPTVTQILTGLMAIVFLIGWMPDMEGQVLKWVACDGNLTKFWTFLTYPFSAVATGGGLIFLALQIVWFYFVSTAIEKVDRAKGFLLIFFGYTLFCSISVAVVGSALKIPVMLVGVTLPLSALTCLWCARNQTMKILLMGIIPVSGKILAVITVVSTFLIVGSGAPLLGLLGAIPCVVAWFHGTGAFESGNRKPVVSGRGQRAQSAKEFDEFLGQVRNKEKDREDRERLRRLFEGGDSTEEPEK